MDFDVFMKLDFGRTLFCALQNITLVNADRHQTLCVGVFIYDGVK